MVQDMSYLTYKCQIHHCCNPERILCKTSGNGICQNYSKCVDKSKFSVDHLRHQSKHNQPARSAKLPLAELKNLLSFHSWAWFRHFRSVGLEKYHCTVEHDKNGIDTTVILTLIQPRVYPDRLAWHFPMIGNEAISLARIQLFQSDPECQYSGIFESLAVIGWLCEDLYPVSLYMDKERGLAEDFCKLCRQVSR